MKCITDSIIETLLKDRELILEKLVPKEELVLFYVESIDREVLEDLENYVIVIVGGEGR